MVRKIVVAYLIALGFGAGAGLFGLALALVAYPVGWQYIPIACSSVGWTLGFTLGLAWLDVANHSPTDNVDQVTPDFVEREWVPDGVGGWLDADYKEQNDG